MAEFGNSTSLIASKQSDRLYDGTNLAEKFADEISSNYSGDVWAWIKARTQAGNFSGIHVGDFIPFTLNAGTVGSDNIASQVMEAQIAGIDTYYGYGDTAVGHHIDFISKTCVNKTFTWQISDNNNGSATQNHPWLQSKAYAYLNGVNNVANNGYNNATLGFNASAGGILQLLPTALQNVITNKRQILEKRYNANGLLTNSTGWGWADMGKLWLPSEMEVYGTQVWSGGCCVDGHSAHASSGGIQYPLFASTGGFTHRRLKGTSTATTSRVPWWLSTTMSGSSTRACYVSGSGNASNGTCPYGYVYAPVCFRIA